MTSSKPLWNTENRVQMQGTPWFWPLSWFKVTWTRWIFYQNFKQESFFVYIYFIKFYYFLSVWEFNFVISHERFLLKSAKKRVCSPSNPFCCVLCCVILFKNKCVHQKEEYLENLKRLLFVLQMPEVFNIEWRYTNIWVLAFFSMGALWQGRITRVRGDNSVFQGVERKDNK